jgi:hypothetical protein
VTQFYASRSTLLIAKSHHSRQQQISRHCTTLLFVAAAIYGTAEEHDIYNEHKLESTAANSEIKHEILKTLPLAHRSR